MIPGGRRFTALAGLLASMMGLSACASGSYQCTDPLGCLEVPNGDPLVIGAILATSGDYALTGPQILQAVQIEFENQPDILDHPIRFLKLTTDCTPDGALQAAAEFSRNASLVAVIGPSCLEEQVMASPVLDAAGIASLSPIADLATALDGVDRLLAAISQVAVIDNGNMYLPRQALFDALQPQPGK
jgi:ABC-type branched-subunit amino acid transport system substrate-binding protein